MAVSLAATAITDIASRGHSRLTIAIAGRPARCYCGPASNLFCEELLSRLADLLAATDYAVGEALSQALETAPRGARILVISSRPSNDASLVGGPAELPIEPDELAWIDTGSDELETQFVLD